MIRIGAYISVLCALLAPFPSDAQNTTFDRIDVKLTDPSKPAYVELSLVNGGITVKGYDGQEVIVEAEVRTQKLAEDGKLMKTRNGMFKIPVYSSSLAVEERNNKIEISTESWKRAIDVTLQVPRNTSMTLHCVNSGDIYVEGVSGDFDVNNVNGAVTLKNISGSAIAHALNEDLIVTFDSIDPDKPMSFSSLNGDVDVTFPRNVKCDVIIKNDMGDVYSDFEITQIEKPQKVYEENDDEEEGKYRVEIERTFYGEINGGGPEFFFKNFNGDILIRRANGGSR